MKKFIVLLFFCFGITNSQVKQKDTNYIEKNVQTCRQQVNDTLSIYYVNDHLYKNEISIIVKTENTITDKCNNNNFKEDLWKKIKSNQNPLIKINDHFIEGLNVTDFTNLIPNKLVAFKQNNNSIIVLELYSYSYISVGSGYIYQCFKLNKNGKVIAVKMIEKKTPMVKTYYCKIF